MLTDYYKGEVEFKGNCQMGTENFIQSKVSSPDGAKFKPKTDVQVMNTKFDANYSKLGQLQADDICIPLNSAFCSRSHIVQVHKYITIWCHLLQIHTGQ